MINISSSTLEKEVSFKIITLTKFNIERINKKLLEINNKTFELIKNDTIIKKAKIMFKLYKTVIIIFLLISSNL